MVKCLNLKSLSHCIKQQSIIYVIGWVIQLVENLISFFKSLFVSLASCKISLTLIVSEIFNFWFLFVNYIKVFKILFLNYFWCFKECKQLKMLVLNWLFISSWSAGCRKSFWTFSILCQISVTLAVFDILDFYYFFGIYIQI